MYATTTYPTPHVTRLPGPLSLALMLLVALSPLVVPRSLAIPGTLPAPVIATGAFDWSKLPLAFVPTATPSDGSARFQVRGRSGTLVFTPAEVMLAPATTAGASAKAVSLRFEGANPAPTLTGAARLPGTANYLIGDDPAQWRTKLPTYAGIVYRGLYPSIDLRYNGTEGQLNGAYLVAPNADPTRIRWRYDGAGDVHVDEATGNLNVAKTLIAQAPVAWQTIGGRRVPVTSRYVIYDEAGMPSHNPQSGSPETSQSPTIGFALGGYDPSHSLTLAPLQAYSSTRLGGSGFEDGDAITTDSAGNVYVIGSTTSANFSTVGPAQAALAGSQDAFVAKLDPTGSTLLYSTYLGGRGPDNSEGIAVDNEGNAYVSGRTDSANFPTVNPAQLDQGMADMFVAKLDPSGSTLLYSTYLGGSLTDVGEGISVDSAGNAYVTGGTQSSDFPLVTPLQGTFGGGQDIFITKLDTSGRIVYSTFLGGNSFDGGRTTVVDGTGSVYVVGRTRSGNFPTANPFQGTYGGNGDAVLVKLDSSGSTLVYSTYLGGTGSDIGIDLAVDNAGNAYATGRTTSTDFPTANPVQATNLGALDVFVTKLDPSGTALVYSTYLGGNLSDRGEGIEIDSAGNAYIVGGTNSPDFPTVNPLQGTFGGNGDAFVAKLDAGGSTLRYSTFLGGPEFDIGRDIALDSARTTYVTGATGSFGNGGDAFVARLSR